MNPTDISIADCDYTSSDDLKAICSLMNSYILDEMGGGEPLSKLQQLRLVDSLNQHPTSIVLLAKYKDTFSGLLVAFENFSTFTVSPMINIHDLIVLPEHRHIGIGRALLESLKNKAIEKGCSRITLEVRIDNSRAQQLYKSLGFTETDPAMLYWRKNLK